MHRLCVILVALVLAASPVFAASEKHQKLAEELISLTEGDKILDSMKSQMAMIFAQFKAHLEVPEAEKAKLEAYDKKFQAIIDDDLDWKKIRSKYIDLYTSTFSEEETKAIVDFYKSPAGKKLTASMPNLMQQSLNIARTHVQAVIPKLEEITSAMEKEFAPQNATQETAPKK
ncbi:MAG: hypothetical protein JG774_1044 [Desulfomicrobiaceae bacterium]|jgi:hypothetical protein|nr:DUF2059 domain-containing protein [Desulfomicrobiaceae bacterium]MBZ4648538.1 hypothetical protein [Desulfomicrobiaceae bacterium]MBZ4685299.1 hypothetical protein [Desulfomicrobiaceae bacterium]MDI3492616.1 uncharacterized protein [Desulfomicrobiaceae bacterium]MDK2873673.1 uncharacterized protein [Desulfomicrobiaceae bacterium]